MKPQYKKTSLGWQADSARISPTSTQIEAMFGNLLKGQEALQACAEKARREFAEIDRKALRAQIQASPENWI